MFIGITVHGKRASRESFSERTTTEVVSPHGAQIKLQEADLPGQILTPENNQTGKEIASTVIDLRTSQM